jgi:dienelactone hydrolase
VSGSPTGAVLPGWTRSPFSAAGFTRDTFRRGEGPGVIVIHEIPGITPKVLGFAEEVVAAGFTVVMPSLVGDPGRGISAGYALQSFARVCVAKEFTTLALRQTSPIISWLRALATELHGSCGGPGVGAIGMCFSGGFALGMMVDERMVAPVLSQPSLPFAVGKQRAADLNLSPDDLLAVAQRAADGCAVLGLRFDRDMAVGTRFRTLHDLLGDRFIHVDLPSSKKFDHSVLTEQRDDTSVARVIEFLGAKLLPKD